MLKNFFKVAVRNLWKQKGYSFLNIFGLALGMACSLLILLWIRDEKKRGRFFISMAAAYTMSMSVNTMMARYPRDFIPLGYWLIK